MTAPRRPRAKPEKTTDEQRGGAYGDGNEAVLVADLQSGDPPVFHVGLIAIAHMDRAPAADDAGVLVIKPLQPMQIVQVPENRAVLAIDFKGVQRLVPARVTRGLERRER